MSLLRVQPIAFCSFENFRWLQYVGKTKDLTQVSVRSRDSCVFGEMGKLSLIIRNTNAINWIDDLAAVLEMLMGNYCRQNQPGDALSCGWNIWSVDFLCGFYFADLGKYPALYYKTVIYWWYKSLIYYRILSLF